MAIAAAQNGIQVFNELVQLSESKWEAAEKKEHPRCIDHSFRAARLVRDISVLDAKAHKTQRGHLLHRLLEHDYCIPVKTLVSALPEREDIRGALEKALIEVLKVDLPKKRGRALEYVLFTHVRTHIESDELEVARPLLYSLRNEEYSSIALSTYSRELTKRGLFEEALAAALRIQDTSMQQPWALYELAVQIARTGDLKTALDIARTITTFGYKSSAVKYIARTITKKFGYILNARKDIALKCFSDEDFVLALEIASEVIQLGDFALAAEVASKITNFKSQSNVFYEIAKGYAERGVYKFSYDTICLIKDSKTRLRAFNFLSERLQRALRFGEVLEVLDRRDSTKEDKSSAIREFAINVAEQCSYGYAIEFASRIPDTTIKVDTLGLIVRRSAHQDRLDLVKKVAKEHLGGTDRTILFHQIAELERKSKL